MCRQKHVVSYDLSNLDLTMNPFTIKTFWNQSKEVTDILILLPHWSMGEDWIDFIISTWKWVTVPSKQNLLAYMSHEADRWSREIIYTSIDILLKEYAFQDYKITVFDIGIPRAICDMNRTWEKACPNAVDEKKWKTYYDTTLTALYKEIQSSAYCLQFHTMNSRDPCFRFELTENSSEDDILYFLAWCYNWEKRDCNILTELVDHTYITSRRHDECIQSLFQEYSIPLQKNKAYRFMHDFPATYITQNIPSSLIEITKDSIATPDTANTIDSSKIILDQSKIYIFGWLFSDFFVWLIQKTS
jgi:hypothetical protein